MDTYDIFLKKSEQNNWLHLGTDEVNSDIVKRYEIWVDTNEDLYICQILKSDNVLVAKVISS